MNGAFSQNSDPPRIPLSPRYSLRTLLLVITALAFFFGLTHWVSLNTLLILTFVLLILAGHVLGNALGTRLRDGPPTKSAPQPPTSTTNSSAGMVSSKKSAGHEH